MTDKKISELTELNTPGSGDYLLIVDSENNATNKIEASKIINVNASDVISRFDYPRTNFDDILEEDFEFVKLQPIAESATVRYGHNGYDLYVGNNSEDKIVDDVFIGLRYKGNAILPNEILNVKILGERVVNSNKMRITSNFLTSDCSETGISNAVQIFAKATSSNGSNDGSATINITGLKINYAEILFQELEDKTGKITLNQTKTFDLTQPFAYEVFADGYDDD